MRLLALSLALLLLIGCAPSPSPEPTAALQEPDSLAPPDPLDGAAEGGGIAEPDRLERETLIFLSFANYSPGTEFQERMTEALGDKLGALGLPYTVTVKPVVDNLWYRTVMSGEGYDVAFVGDPAMVRRFAGEGLVADLTSALPNYPGLVAIQSTAVWQGWKIDGRDYAVPLMDVDWLDVGWESSFLINQDVLSALGAQPPATVDEFIDLSARAKSAGLDSQIAYFAQYPPYALHRTYEEWPFFVDEDSLFLTWESGETELYFESDIFQRDMALLGQLNDAGIMRYLYDWDQVNSFQGQWNLLASMYPIGWADDEVFPKLGVVQLEPEKPNFAITKLSGSRSLIVSANADVERALAVLQGLYTDQDAYDTLTQGVEGVDWILHPDGSREVVSEDGEWVYGNEPLFRHIPLRRPSFGASPVGAAQHQFGEVIAFPASQFMFSPSADAEQKILGSTGYSSLTSGILAVRAGVAAESLLPNAIKLLYDAGIEGYYEEYKAQMAEYYAMVGD